VKQQIDTKIFWAAYEERTIRRIESLQKDNVINIDISYVTVDWINWIEKDSIEDFATI
jgi:hypothetical protein